jgi:murein DD-endopeptidase MepM/ murein hydrolase activator NlpD
MATPKIGTEAVAALFLGVLALAALNHVRDGTLGPWVAAKFLSRGEAPPPAPAGTLAPAAGGSGSAGTAQFGDPVPSATLVSGWGAPRDGGARTHQGVDLAAPRGTPIVAVANGTVAYVVNSGRCGKGVGINHADGWRSVYCHLDSVSVSKGGTVRRGQAIGTVGNTGNAATTGPHLHFELRRHDQPVNPQALIGR